MNKTTRNYRATFILDNRGKEESADALIEGVKKEIAAVQGDVTAVENHGRRDFVRITDKKRTAGIYVQVLFSGAAQVPGQLKERLRLNPTVYRTFVQSA